MIKKNTKMKWAVLIFLVFDRKFADMENLLCESECSKSTDRVL